MNIIGSFRKMMGLSHIATFLRKEEIKIVQFLNGKNLQRRNLKQDGT
jgi:hypothetical protein